MRALLTLIAALLLFASCEKEELVAPEVPKKELVKCAGCPKNRPMKQGVSGQ